MVDQRAVLGWLQTLKPLGRDAAVEFIVSFIASVNMVPATSNIPVSVEFQEVMLSKVMLSYDLSNGIQVLETSVELQG